MCGPALWGGPSAVGRVLFGARAEGFQPPRLHIPAIGIRVAGMAQFTLVFVICVVIFLCGGFCGVVGERIRADRQEERLWQSNRVGTVLRVANTRLTRWDRRLLFDSLLPEFEETLVDPVIARDPALRKSEVQEPEVDRMYGMVEKPVVGDPPPAPWDGRGRGAREVLD